MATKDLVFTVLGIDKASRTFDRVGDSMDRMGSRATKALGGITAGSGAAAAAVGASVGALPVAFATLGAVALRENEAIRDSFSALSDTLNEGLAADAEALAPAFVGAAEDIGTAYEQLRPQLRDAFEASVPHVATLTEGVLDFARNAMPGMVTAVQTAGPVMDGLASLMRDTGIGVGQFFSTLASGATESGQAVEHLGQLVEQSLPEIGSTLVGLTGLWAEHGDEVSDVVTRMMGVINDLGGSAMPVVSSAIGVATDALSGALTVIEPLTGAIGPLIGSWLALATAMRGMRAVRGVAAGVATSVDRMRESVGRAAGSRGIGRLSVAARSAVGLLGGPWGIAVAGATAVLASFGAQSVDVASSQRSLASALRDSGGEFDANARSALLNSEQYAQVRDHVREAGLSHEEYIDALVEGGPALGAVRSQLQQQRDALEQAGIASGGLTDEQTKQAESVQTLLDRTGGLRSTVQGAASDFREEEQAITSAGEAMMGSVPGADALDEAINTLKNDTADTADRADALNTAWRRLFGVQLNLEEATGEYHEGLRQLRDAMDDAGVGAGNWRDSLFTASGAVDTTTTEGWELWQSLQEQGEAYRTLGQTAYDTALQQGDSHEQALATARDTMAKQRAEFRATMREAGFTTAEIDRLANTYFGVPDHVSTGFSTPGSWEAKNEAYGVRDAVQSIPTTRIVNIVLREPSGQSNPGSGIPLPFRAAGGPVASRRPVLVGEQGPELLFPTGPGRVLSHERTREVLREPATPSAGPRSAVHIDTLITSPDQSPADIATELDWMSRGYGRGR